MTTKVKIELVQEHLSAVITVASGPEALPTKQVVLSKVGDSFEDYIHSNQYIVIHEMSTAEAYLVNRQM